MLENMKRKQPTNLAGQKRVREKLTEYMKTVEKLSTQVDDVCKRQEYQEAQVS